MEANQDLFVKNVDILVVDDSTASLRMLADILTREGYKIRPVEDPQRALDAALTLPPSLILLDVKMSKMSGFELCRRLKRDERTREIPVIFISALDELQDRIQGFEVGGVDFISKPVQELEVRARVKTHIQLRGTQLHLEKLVAQRTTELERLLQERSEALQSAQEQIRALFENSPIGIALSTYGGEILTYNKALLEMLRISEEELLREGAANFYANSADRGKLLAAVQESGSVQQFGIPLVRHDGSSFFGSVSMSRLLLEGNEVLLVMAEDVTDEITAKQQTAIIEERERLARELHDSVTQTLFSASVLAQSAPRLMEKNPAMAQQNMEQQSLLIRGALAEMRSLLFELRPNESTAANLTRMFELLAESARARTRANVILNVSAGDLPAEDVATAFYRIAQESLNNIAKHALASEVLIDLHCDTDGTRLIINDDGRGFDPQAILAGHMGVGIMRERARKIGAEMEIRSEIGTGTEVRVSWSATEGKGEDE